MFYQDYCFLRAQPVWETGKCREMNQALRFVASLPSDRPVSLRLACCSQYRVFIDGSFLCAGPARAAKGFFRVDEMPLPTGKEISVIVANSYCKSFEFQKQPAFFCGELISGDLTLAATGHEGWRAYHVPERLQKVQRYSVQRGFCEVYDLSLCGTGAEVSLSACEKNHFIARGIPFPAFPISEAVCVERGTVADCPAEIHYADRAILKAGNSKYDGFPPDTLDRCSVWEAEDLSLKKNVNCDSFPQILEKEYLRVKFPSNLSGMIGLELFCKSDADLYLTFDEILSDGKIHYTRMECSNVVAYRLVGGMRYSLLTFEPYTLQYLDLIVKRGVITVEKVFLRRVEFDRSRILCHVKNDADEQIKLLYDAAVSTFCQNSIDLFSDCPSRERAGWLCDSFFTSRVEYLLSGKNRIEQNFLANFGMTDRFDPLPDGMLPMCYPADPQNAEAFIPNWAMWFFLELAESVKRTKDRSFALAFREKAEALLKWFRRYENADGLLEKLPGWVFVEWSRCNQLVQDINYPTNMLYCLFKRVLAELYGLPSLAKEAFMLKENIRKQSKQGLFFVENAVYDAQGLANLSGEITETCQYYAFFTGVANFEEDRNLWEVLRDDFGPERHTTKKWKEIHPSNAFIGNYLRLELLDRAGEFSKLEQNIRDYFTGMAKKTGTLWEHDKETASCNHGFASHILIWLNRIGYFTILCSSTPESVKP